QNTGIENYESQSKFDLIVSNPPFFLNSLKNLNERKTLSRHASIQFYESLFNKCKQLLTSNGVFQIIWPVEVRDQLLKAEIASRARLYSNEEIYIRSFPDSNPFRMISSFRLTAVNGY